MQLIKHNCAQGCDQIIVVGHKSAAEMQVDDVEDYDYDNPADRNDYCPDVDDDQDAYGENFLLKFVISFIVHNPHVTFKVKPSLKKIYFQLE